MGDTITAINEDWQLLSTDAGAFDTPATLSNDGPWLAARVPGTVAVALRDAGQWNLASPAPLHHRDHWYRTRFNGRGARTLRFAGLATLAEVWLNGTLILRSDNMFIAHDVDVRLIGDNELCICFRAMDALLSKPMKRARWRPAMIVPSSLRSVRTTLLGHMPGWCPAVHAIGPWRSIHCIESAALSVADVSLSATLQGSDVGLLRIKARIKGATADLNATLECANRSAAMQLNTDGEWTAQLTLDQVQAWWPHTHGTPHLYSVTLRLGDGTFDLGKVGFRRIEVDRGVDGHGFALRINDIDIFCRGACWTNADIVGLSDQRTTYQPWLEQMVAANMNMVRVGGTMVYEGNAFYQLCDELGLLVWQDFMFANFDYPIADEAFATSVRAEVTQFLRRTQASPSITVLCGGSEVAQQAAMLGLPPATWTGPLFDELLPSLCAAVRPDVPYVPNSPYGGALPFIANHGVTHYYGVGAYLRPLDDARRAEVRFASECLAFSNVPQATSPAALPAPAVHHPDWKCGVPRDRNASWDFEDVRDHYFKLLYQLDPVVVRRRDPQRYLKLSQAVTGLVMEAAFAEWRRHRSTTSGALVWTYQDLMPGAGWGVIDAAGEPKAAWYALRRAFRSVQVNVTDEGVNGLAIHVINDTAVARELTLTLTCLHHATPIVSAERVISLGAHQTQAYSSAELLEQFFDITYAYRFGPPAHECSVISLSNAIDGELVAQAFHFPHGFDLTQRDLGLQARVEHDDGQWRLHITTSKLALAVHIDDEHFRAEDSWFHLAPNQPRTVRLMPRSGADAVPDGAITALNSSQSLRYRVSA